MSTEAIKKFLRTAYTDERLAALKAYVEDDKLRFISCCCFIGAATTDEFWSYSNRKTHRSRHYLEATQIEGAQEAEEEAFRLGKELNEKLLPLIEQEIAHRDFVKAIEAGCNFQKSELLANLAMSEIAKHYEEVIL